MDDYLKKLNVERLAALDRGEVPEDLSRLVSTLRELAVRFERPFPSNLTDAELARSAYFSKGPKKVLELIEKLYDLRQAQK